MSHSQYNIFHSTCLILSCTVEEFRDIYESEAPECTTETFCEDVLTNVIPLHHTALRAVHKQYRLDELLFAMLQFAPHTLGKRYVAVALHIANGKGGDVVLDIAKAWMQNLFVQVLGMLKPGQNSGDATPIYAALSESSQCTDPLMQQLVNREQHRCAITRAFDRRLGVEYRRRGLDQNIPQGVLQLRMKATPILPQPFSLYHDLAASDIEQPDARAVCWDMFSAWTQIDITELSQSMNTPRNFIHMTDSEDELFRQFDIYLDGTVYPHSPNKYALRIPLDGLALSNGAVSGDVEFRTATESGVDPPDPEYIKVHAAFARVLDVSGIKNYFDWLEDQSHDDLFRGDKLDFTTALTSKLSLIARS
ncbi:hypothetical protein BDN72DRAFT_898760 [Pluteus cervinus]|uniref:Uncharacterized protein n=1 Tax=Pluteus cervinus TaxID=181527 RepID=A0ACD3APL6_9AGAR|nr:hypothetical protein BDN72DRAFT_898760 [Pluteus cervinus]